MKRIWVLWAALLATAVFLAACSAATNDRTAEVETAVAALPTATGASVAITDLSQIGATGRPQFLNAYASW